MRSILIALALVLPGALGGSAGSCAGGEAGAAEAIGAEEAVAAAVLQEERLIGSTAFVEMLQVSSTAFQRGTGGAQQKTDQTEATEKSDTETTETTAKTDGELLTAGLAPMPVPNETAQQTEPQPLLGSGSGWSQGGDKMWGSGQGLESINRGNAGYYDQGMAAARGHCGGPHCALIVNPPGHRTVNHFHIHFVHYHGYGHRLKQKLESKVCGKPGWHSGGLPCHGKAAYFPGFPAVFSEAMAGHGGIQHGAGVIAWPASCGGSGTIVEIAYGCSIEHQIRGDYNPRYR